MNMSDTEWAEQLAAWAKQQRSPFVRYTLVKRDAATGALAPLTPADTEELARLASPPLRKELGGGGEPHWVATALKVMQEMRKAHPLVKTYFCVPVPVHQVVDYPSIIYHPQDLGSIEAGLKSGALGHPETWQAAVRTVFRNAYVYNKGGPVDPTGQVVLTVAEAASRVFELAMFKERNVVMLL